MKLNVRNDSGSIIYLSDFGQKKIADAQTVTLRGSTTKFTESTELETKINDGDLVVILDGTDLTINQAQELRTKSVIVIGEYGESESTSSTTSTGWKQKLRVTFTAKDSDYLISWTGEIYCSDSSARCRTRIQEGDSTTYCETDWLPDTADADGWGPTTGFKRVTMTSGAKNIDFDYCSSSGGKTVKLRRARISIVEVF